MEQKRLQKKKTFPEQLKYQRELRGWSQAKMAEEIGATPNRISSWERGVALPGAYFREQLCRLLSMNAQELGLLPTSDDGDFSYIQATSPEQDISSAHDTLPESSAYEAPLEQEVPLVQDILPIQHVSSSQGTSSELDGEALPPTRQLQVQPRDGLVFVARKRRLRTPVVLVTIVMVLAVLGSAAWYGLANGLFAPGQTNPYLPYGGQLALNDTLQHQNSDHNWQVGTNKAHASCAFADNGYVASLPFSGFYHACFAQKTDYTNFTYEVTMTIEQGEFGGIVFRSEDSIDGQYYLFRVHIDGSYFVYRFVDTSIANATLLQQSSSPLINKGPGKKNILGVVAQGSSLTLYINRQQVCVLQDAGYTHGQIGVLAGSYNQPSSRALFTDAKVWTS